MLSDLVLEKTLESALYSKEIKSVNLQENQPWIFTGRTDAEAPILWPPDEKSWLTGKDPDSGKDWGQEEKQVTGDEMVGWHHRYKGHGFEQTLEDSERWGSLVCCSPWGHKESDTTGQLNNNIPLVISYNKHKHYIVPMLVWRDVRLYRFTYFWTKKDRERKKLLLVSLSQVTCNISSNMSS